MGNATTCGQRMGERFIDVDEALLELLERSVDRDRRLLACGPA